MDMVLQYTYQECEALGLTLSMTSWGWILFGILQDAVRYVLTVTTVKVRILLRLFEGDMDDERVYRGDFP